jgi:hypothetical protein
VWRQSFCLLFVIMFNHTISAKKIDFMNKLSELSWVLGIVTELFLLIIFKNWKVLHTCQAEGRNCKQNHIWRVRFYGWYGTTIVIGETLGVHCFICDAIRNRVKIIEKKSNFVIWTYIDLYEIFCFVDSCVTLKLSTIPWWRIVF